MENTQDTPKKCYCARCFLPIDENEKVEVDGQNFHRHCGTCCICHTIPLKLKMFHGHVFCEECFKTFVLARLRGENPQVQVNSWWMQFAPGVKTGEKPEGKADDNKDAPKPMPESKSCAEGHAPSPETKSCVCARCLQAVADADRVDIGGQTFHCNCARCCACHQVPKDTIKFYYGQVFCEECFHRHILSRNRDNPTEFFNNCFEQWKNNAQFAESMKAFMASGASSPLVFVAPPACRTDAERDAGLQSQESKSATTTLEDSNTWDLSIEHRTEVSIPESRTSSVAAEKIEKLTKYLCKTSSFNMETPKKWKIVQDSLESIDTERAKLQRPGVPSKLTCPKCLWQFGTIVVDRES